METTPTAAYRRPLTEEEQTALTTAADIFWVQYQRHNYDQSARRLPLPSTFRASEKPLRQLTPDVELSRTEPSDVFDLPSDPSVLATITKQLRRQPYAEFTPLHFDGGLEGKRLTLRAHNPYLSPLTQSMGGNPGRQTFSAEESFAKEYGTYFESKPVPVYKELTPDIIRAHRIGRQTLLSCYEIKSDTRTPWQDMSQLSLVYNGARVAGSPLDMLSTHFMSVHQPKVEFSHEQVAPRLAQLTNQLKSAAKPLFYEILADFESYRYGPKAVLYRPLGQRALKSTLQAVEYGYAMGWDVDMSSTRPPICRADTVTEHDGTLWIEDHELGIEVPYRIGSRLSSYTFGGTSVGELLTKKPRRR